MVNKIEIWDPSILSTIDKNSEKIDSQALMNYQIKLYSDKNEKIYRKKLTPIFL